MSRERNTAQLIQDSATRFGSYHLIVRGSVAAL
jgi:hypothetical protein